MKIFNSLKMSILFSPFFLYFIISCTGTTDPTTDQNSLEYVTPEDVGYSSQALAEVREACEQSGYAAMMALYDGKVFFQWGNISYNYNCHSIRKPFLSALYGIHVNQGNIDTAATLAELNIDDLPPVLTAEERQAKVHHLLKSRSGVYHEAAAETPSMIAARPERGSHPPGTHYYYNNWDFNALGTIFEQETGTGIFEEFRDQIAGPIGMEDFSISNCTYQYEEGKSQHPAYMFRMSARDMARFAVLYQNNGLWQGRRLIPQDWITQSTYPHSVEDSASGLCYGMMWRVFPEGSLIADLAGHPGYYHTGIGVHAMIIIPDLKLVLVQRYDTDGVWQDPGDVGMQIGMMIINARLEQ